MIDFFSKLEAFLNHYRSDVTQTTESLLKVRELSEGLETCQIYETIKARISGAKSKICQSKPATSTSTSEKMDILSQYFAADSLPNIHVIQGPPGTGKTEISAFYILLFILKWQQEKKTPAPKIIVSAFTHKAIDNVLLRIERLFPVFYAMAIKEEILTDPTPFARMIKLHAVDRRSRFAGEDDGLEEASEHASHLLFGTRSGKPINDLDEPLGVHDMRVNWGNLSFFLKENEKNADEDCPGGPCVLSRKDKNNFKYCTSECLLKRIQSFDRPTIIGCTTSQLIKLKTKVGNHSPESEDVDFLLLDEASMIMLPDFLPLADRVNENGLMVVVGDDLQLGPISQNDWTREIRPSLIEDKPWNSVFHYLRRKANPEPQHKGSTLFTCDGDRIAWASLKTTYRLTESVKKLIQPAYDSRQITLQTPPSPNHDLGLTNVYSFRHFEVENSSTSLCGFNPNSYDVSLISHNGSEATTSSDIEAELILKVLEGISKVLPKIDFSREVAIVTPYHDQIDLLKQKLGNKYNGLLIDTVNKLQGDEREFILFSAVVSGESAIQSHGQFVLELQRTNVAFSRAKKHLIVFASNTLLDYIPSGFQEYQGALLWKNLRRLVALNVAVIEQKTENLLQQYSKMRGILKKGTKSLGELKITLADTSFSFLDRGRVSSAAHSWTTRIMFLQDHQSNNGDRTNRARESVEVWGDILMDQAPVEALKRKLQSGRDYFNWCKLAVVSHMNGNPKGEWEMGSEAANESLNKVVEFFDSVICSPPP